MEQNTGRVIKFRVWDGREMDISGGLHMTVGGDVCVYPVSERSKYVLMQFTGLTDKNGKEIYEGDILEGPTRYGWKKLEVKYQPKDNYGLYPFYVGMMQPDTCEVIGNIYENPELLA